MFFKKFDYFTFSELVLKSAELSVSSALSVVSAFSKNTNNLHDKARQKCLNYLNKHKHYVLTHIQFDADFYSYLMRASNTCRHHLFGVELLNIFADFIEQHISEVKSLPSNDFPLKSLLEMLILSRWKNHLSDSSSSYYERLFKNGFKEEKKMALSANFIPFTDSDYTLSLCTRVVLNDVAKGIAGEWFLNQFGDLPKIACDIQNQFNIDLKVLYSQLFDDKHKEVAYYRSMDFSILVGKAKLDFLISKLYFLNMRIQDAEWKKLNEWERDVIRHFFKKHIRISTPDSLLYHSDYIKRIEP